MQWSAASCVQEIQNVSKILKTRNTADVATAMVENLKIKLFKLGKLDMGECVMLYEAVKESDLISEHQAELNKVIDGKITTGGNDDVEEVNGYGQKIDDSLNWLTQSEWDLIEAPEAQYHSILVVVTERLKKLRVDSLKESSVKSWTAMLVNVAMNKVGKMPSYEQIYQLSCDLKQYLKSSAMKPDPRIPLMKVFPTDPKLLSASVLQLVYPDEQPIQKTGLDKVAALVADHIPVRDSSKLLSKNHKKKVQSVEDVMVEMRALLAGAEHRRDGRVGDIPIMMMSSAQQHAQHKQLGDSPEGSTQASPTKPMNDQPDTHKMMAVEDQPSSLARQASHIFQPRVRVPFGEGAADPQTTDASAKDSPHQAAPKQLDTAEALEQAAFEALNMKKPSAAKLNPAAPNKSASKAPPKPSPKTPMKTTPMKAMPKTPMKAAPKTPMKTMHKTPMKMTKSTTTTSSAKKGVKTGCKKCRGASCAKCLNPSFRGWRGTYEEWLVFGYK